MAAPRGLRTPARSLLMLLLVVALAVLCVTAGRDYYEVLGVTRDASSAEIKRAFRKLSLKVSRSPWIDLILPTNSIDELTIE